MIPLITIFRGALDNKAYMTQREFDELLERLDLNEITLRDNYDAVIHLCTAAKGADKHNFHLFLFVLSLLLHLVYYSNKFALYLPEFIEIIKEVTDDNSYKNASLASRDI